VVDHRPHWTFVNFENCFERWVALDAPDDDLRLRVATWAFDRQNDPYLGARREPGFPNLWFVPIPGAFTAAGRQVTCSYWIEAASWILRCDAITELSPPF
jgi:hypothetical protein